MGIGDKPSPSGNDPARMCRESIRGYLSGLYQCLQKLDHETVLAAVRILDRAYHAKAKIFLIGNGGSACTASHLATDLTKTIRGVPANPAVSGFRAMALMDNVGLLTAWANDESYDSIFAEQLRQLAQPGDVLVAISGSGNSKNIISAVRVARGMGVQVIGLLGKGGGQVRELADVAVITPSDDYGVIEAVHLAIGHSIARYFRSRIAGDPRIL
jgi:D-sedoheptulose 7-phosphate isomerase